MKELQVKGQEKALIEKTISINNLAIANAEDAMESIQHSLKKGVLSDQIQESAIKNLVAINSDIAKRSQENEVLRQKLEIKGAEVFVQEPNLPQLKTTPKLGLVWGASFFISAFFILIFVFVRKAIQAAQQNAEAAQKIFIIKSLLSFKHF